MLLRYRVKVGDRYCQLSTRYHEEGVLLPVAEPARVTAFRQLAPAIAAITRTVQLQAEVRQSLYAENPLFSPLLFPGQLDYEQFTVEEPCEDPVQ